MNDDDRITIRFGDLLKPLTDHCYRHRLDKSHVIRNAVRALLGKQLVEPVAKETKTAKVKK